MDAPDFQQRPPTVSREWWYHPRTTWYARQQAIRAWLKETRPVERIVEREDIDIPVGASQISRHERTAAVEMCLEAGLTAEQVVAEMGVKAATVVRALERCNRRDLLPEFRRLARLEDKARAA